LSAERRARFNRIADEIAVREGLGAVTFKAIYARTRGNRGYAEALYREWLARTAGFAALMPPALEALSLKLGRETWVLAGIALGRAGRAAAGRAGAGIGPDQNREEDAGGRPPDAPAGGSEVVALGLRSISDALRPSDLRRLADYVITNKVPLGQAQLEAAPRLKLIAIAATGYDVVDIRACAAKNVAVVNIRNYAVNTVPEHTFALILGLRRSILAYRESVQAGRWQEAAQFCYFDYPVNDLSHSTLGIIGDGALGKMVGDLGRAFGMKVLFSTYKNTEGMGPLYTPFEEVMAKSDVITLHAIYSPYDLGRGVRTHGEATLDHQYRARWPSR
jgi:hypothetical protein